MSELLKKKIEKELETGVKMLNDLGSIQPMISIDFVLDDGKETIVPIMIMDDNKPKRDMFLNGLGILFGLYKTIGRVKELNSITMLSEAWMSVVKKQDAEMKRYPKPSEDPNRIEALIVSGIGVDGVCLMTGKEIVSVEVKGKRHFSLNEITHMKDAVVVESTPLKAFMDGFNRVINEKDKEKIAFLMQGFTLFKDKTFDEMLKGGIDVLVKQVGGLSSQIINLKK